MPDCPPPRPLRPDLWKRFSSRDNATLEIRQLLSYIGCVSDARYEVGELAALGGVSRRTVRYYVQEGLLAPPDGLGRGASYGEGHLERLLKVRSLQEQGLTLDEVRHALRAGQGDSSSRDREEREEREGLAPPRRAVLTRIELAPGVELLVDGRLRLPSPGKLEELSDWCRKNLQRETGGNDVEQGD